MVITLDVKIIQSVTDFEPGETPINKPAPGTVLSLQKLLATKSKAKDSDDNSLVTKLRHKAEREVARLISNTGDKVRQIRHTGNLGFLPDLARINKGKIEFLQELKLVDVKDPLYESEGSLTSADAKFTTNDLKIAGNEAGVLFRSDVDNQIFGGVGKYNKPLPSDGIVSAKGVRRLIGREKGVSAKEIEQRVKSALLAVKNPSTNGTTAQRIVYNLFNKAQFVTTAISYKTNKKNIVVLGSYKFDNWNSLRKLIRQNRSGAGLSVKYQDNSEGQFPGIRVQVKFSAGISNILYDRIRKAVMQVMEDQEYLKAKGKEEYNKLLKSKTEFLKHSKQVLTVEYSYEKGSIKSYDGTFILKGDQNIATKTNAKSKGQFISKGELDALLNREIFDRMLHDNGIATPPKMHERTGTFRESISILSLDYRRNIIKYFYLPYYSRNEDFGYDVEDMINASIRDIMARETGRVMQPLAFGLR